jgi:SAM-dependent methyltransferase
MRNDDTNIRDAFLLEYTDEDSIKKYITNTSGKGIQYILTNVYGPLYSTLIDSICLKAEAKKGFRVLEYGCGAGMNLLYIIKLLNFKEIPLHTAIGTDFSPTLLQAAERECERFSRPEDRKKITFLQASNEALLGDLAKGLSQDESALQNRFDLIVGVNTFRYASRLDKQQKCANDIAYLLAPGGYSIMIDMNNKFPFFKSRFRFYKRKPKEQTWLPSLEEYTAPFRSASLEILETKHFCWIPHSASTPILVAAKLATPILDVVAPSFAMRSLVIARKSKESNND